MDDFDMAAYEELERSIPARQRRFIEEYEKDLNGTEAAIRAGYAASAKDEASRKRSAAVAASRMLRNDKLSAYRRARARLLCEQIGLDNNKIILRLEDIFKRCTAAEPVMAWDSEAHDWRESGVWKFDAKNALRALELMGGELGMFGQKVQVSGSIGGIESYLAKLDEEEGK